MEDRHSGQGPLDRWRRRLEQGGHQPWLFYREGWDWRWSSREELLERALAIGREAASPDSLGDRVVSFGPCEPPLEHALDLAVLLSGACPAPRLEAAKRSGRSPSVTRAANGGASLRRAKDGAWRIVGGDEAAENPEAGSPSLPFAEIYWRIAGHFERVPLATLAAWSEALEGALRGPSGSVSRRSQRSPSSLRRLLGLGAARRVAVTCGSLAHADHRLGWAWSLETGAALVIAPSRASWLDVVLFSRPTDLWGDHEQLEQLDEAAATRSGRRALDRLGAFALFGQPESDHDAGEDLETRALTRLEVRVEELDLLAATLAAPAERAADAPSGRKTPPGELP